MRVSQDLPYIIQLLDDPAPEIKAAVAQYLDQFDGDISEELASHALTLSPPQRREIALLTLPGRRRVIEELWSVPLRFQQDQSNDWATFEHLLSLIADYLHDGVTIRPSMADSLDLLADEAHLAEAHTNEKALADFLFLNERFSGNKRNYFAKENSDLIWVLENNIGNPISLVIVYMLLGNRFGLNVFGCNYPGHFLAWVEDTDGPHLVDAYNKARQLSPHTILQENPNISENAIRALQGPCTFNIIIQRILNNIEAAYGKEGIMHEASLIQKLRASLIHPSIV